MKLKFGIAIILLFGSVLNSRAIDTTATEAQKYHDLVGATLSPFWALPFVGIILSIALFPLFAPSFWSKHYGKVSLAWTLITIGALIFVRGIPVTVHAVVAELFDEYFPFVFLLTALFTITGGIKLNGNFAGTPPVNVGILAAGAILSSWLGTTGAAVLLIRPLLAANAWRQRKAHTIMFFIFIVANIAGSLTPVGNPPILMSFISSVPFFWSMQMLAIPTLFATLLLLGIYYLVDWHFYQKDKSAKPKEEGPISLSLKGTANLVLLIIAISAVIISSFDMGVLFTIYNVKIGISLVTELVMLALLTYISIRITPKAIRKANNFSWEPMLEVGKLFVGIFICMIPLVAMLKAGESGAMSPLIKSLTSASGNPINGMYYWLSGLLSAFLDSAPAFLVFFNVAASPAAGAGLVAHAYMTNVVPHTLMAIMIGASFMGALTYIGNAPNMMVKAIAEENGVKMPTFFAYLFWASVALIPVFILVQLVFIG